MRALAVLLGGLGLLLMQFIWGYVERAELRKRVFLPSEYIMKTPFFRFTVLLMRPWLWWYDYSVVNGGIMKTAAEHDDTLPAEHHRAKRDREHQAATAASHGARARDTTASAPSKYGPGVLLVTYHSTNNMDIFVNGIGSALATGRVLRAMVHRLVMAAMPFFRLYGAVPGSRETAIKLLEHGYVSGVVPGGSEEAMTGHENAYKLRWVSAHGRPRQGFAHVAKTARARVVPCFTVNAEEMKWNPVLWLANKLLLTRAYDRVATAGIPGLSFLVHRLGSFVWFAVTFAFGIPIPVKVTLVLGDPIEYDPASDSAQTIAERTRAALEGMIARYQPNGVDYAAAIRARFSGEGPIEAAARRDKEAAAQKKRAL